MVEAYLLADEAFELIGAYLSQAFESGNLGILRLGDGLQALLLGVAVAHRLLVLHAEKRRLQDIHMPLLDQIGEELQEEREHKQANMHAVHIGIGGDNHLVVAQFIQSVLYVQRRLQAVELLVLVHHRLAQSVGVERLSAQGEHRLRAHIAALGDRARRRETLRDEDTALLPQIVIGVFCRLHGLGVVVMHLTVAQLRVVQLVLLRPLARRLRYARYRLALFLRVLYLLQHHLRYLGVLVQVVVQLLLDKVIDELIH